MLAGLLDPLACSVLLSALLRLLSIAVNKWSGMPTALSVWYSFYAICIPSACLCIHGTYQ